MTLTTTPQSLWPSWLRAATTHNARVEINGRVIWRGGVWNAGDWYAGDWRGGLWNGGNWRGGDWYAGDWRATPCRVLDLGHDTRGYARSVQRLDADGVTRFRAGCRLFTFPEARAHWGEAYRDRAIGDDYLRLLDYAERAGEDLGR